MDWDYLTSAPEPDEVFGPFSTVYLLICAVGLVVAFLLYSRPGILWSRHLMRISTTRRWATIFIWIFSLGFMFFIIGWLQINPFTLGNRIWLVLTLIAAAIAAVLLILEMRVETAVLSQEQQAYREAVARGTHTRRPPRRSRTRKR
jgi:hypothetical protein